MKNDQEIQRLSIQDLVSGTQSCVHTDDNIHFRTNRFFHELVRRCIKERGLASEAEFFTKLANDYFSKYGWMKREERHSEFLTAADLGMTEEQCNIAMRKQRIRYQQKHPEILL